MQNTTIIAENLREENLRSLGQPQNVRMTMEELKATHQTPHVKERADGWRGSDVIEHAAGHSGT